VDTRTLSVETGLSFVSCYGAPIIDDRYNRIIVAGYHERILSAVRKTDLTQGTLTRIEKDVSRGVLVGDDYWFAGGTGYLQIRKGSELDYFGKIKVDDGPLTGVWYDEVRQLIWVGVQSTQEIRAYSVIDKSEVHRVSLSDTALDVFPIGP